jgi:hypothetical protein
VEDSKRELCKQSISLHGSDGKLEESFFTGISARYVRHVKEGFGNESSLSL